MSDYIQLKRVPISGQAAPLHFGLAVNTVWLLLSIYTGDIFTVALGCLLPCANCVWGKQLKRYIRGLWTAPITANTIPRRRTCGSYLHKCVHLSSVRIPGSRSSEPGLPPPHTADCRDHFLQQTKITARSQSSPDYTQLLLQDSHWLIWCLKFFIPLHFLCCPGNSLLCCFSIPKVPIDNGFTHSPRASLPAGSSLSWAIVFTTTESILPI